LEHGGNEPVVAGGKVARHGAPCFLFFYSVFERSGYRFA
jgi:hypothetical protein